MSTPTDIRVRFGVRPIVNLTGTLTVNGGMNAVPEAIEAAAAMMGVGVEVAHLQAAASKVIARITGAEAGFVAGCTSAGLCMGLAGAITGSHLGRIEKLPDTTGMKDEVVVQWGHLTNYGHPGAQDIRLVGAKVVAVGDVNSCRPYQLEEALNERTAAALYVVSHHCTLYGQIPFKDFVEMCHARGVPVIVDLAAEYDLTGYIAAGADLAVHSSQKFLSGPTAGIVAGKKDLVRAAYLQNYGIGRPMKVGKEGVAGAIAALEAWEARDHKAHRARQLEVIQHWAKHFGEFPGITCSVSPDPTGNPFDRLQVTVDAAKAGLTAAELVQRLEAGSPPVLVRSHQLEFGYFIMDPRSLRDGERDVVSARVCAELEAAGKGSNGAATGQGSAAYAYRAKKASGPTAWPDIL